MTLSHDNLANFIKTNWSLVQFHKYSLTELENMMPWERSAFIDMLQEHIRRENEMRRDRESEMKAIERKLRNF